ncbi:type I-E CRISPR-associated protein Cse2/CasB [Stutzerimonas sp. NM35]
MESVQSQAQTPPAREERFISGVIQRCQQDKGLAARLRRADNPATEYQSWELLAGYGIDLEDEWQRLPFATVAAAIAKAKSERNGVLSLGRAIAACYVDGRESSQAKARLRRLLACDDLAELCRILRPLFSLIDSKAGQPLDYLRLLRQLRRFGFAGQQVKAQWAQEFYGQPAATDEGADT